jgi:uncharacterized protein YbjQ (UPF0145 family)
MSGDDEVGEKSDLTRIEDLSEFLHQDDPDVDAQLDTSSDSPPPVDELPGLDDLEDGDEEESFPEFRPNSEDEDESEEQDSLDDFSSTDETQSDFSIDSDDFNSDSEDNEDFSGEEFSMEDSSEDFSEDSTEENSFETDDFSMDPQEDDSQEKDTTTEEVSFDDNEDDFSQSFDEESESEGEEESFDFAESSLDDESNEDEVSFEETTEEESFDQLDSTEDTEEEPLEPVSDFAEEVVQEPVQQTYVDKSEKFEDVKSFAKNITYGKIAVGGNPAFSVILRNVKFEEDAEDIIILLREHGVLDESNEESMQQSLESGSLLISQISEYAAIFLTHKFRRFDLDIQMGLSDELHPSKSYERDSVGLISKSRVNQNKSETNRIEKHDIELDSIILATTPTLENYKIVEYAGIVTEFSIITNEQLTSDSQLSELHERKAKGHLDEEKSDNDEEDFEITISHNDIYKDLSEKLRPHCLKKHANAVVGINFQITPLSDGEKYKISCSGSAVWVIDLD